MRDVTLGDTFTFAFSTRAFATGVPTTLAGSPALSVKEGANDTPITAGVSLDVDTCATPVTGLHEGTVVATGANGYEAGKSYAVYISAGTVGGTSVVGEVVEQFTIQASAAAVDLANGTDGLGVIKAETATIQGDTNDIQTRLPAALTAGGNMKADALAWAGAATATDDLALKATLAKGTDLTGFNDLSAAQVNTEVDTALADARLDELLTADSDIDGAAPPTVGSVFHELLTKTAGSFTYDQTTDSLEAVRDRGDAAWITATGFSTLDAAAVRAAVGLAAANLDTQLDALPTAAENADAVLDDVCEAQGSYTLRQVASIVLAVLAGVTSSNGSVLKTPNGVATRVTATLDASNNRTGMTLTP